MGKTRTLTEWIHETAWKYPGCRLAIIAATAGDARRVVIEGVSGLISTQKPWNPCRYWPAKLEVTFENGSHCGVFSADEPDRLRGPQHHAVACDEWAAWKNVEEVWAMIKFGLRLPAMPGWPEGHRPRACIATTPRPTIPLRQLAGAYPFKKPDKTHITTGSTYDNSDNLDPDFFESVISDLEGTRLGQQELNGVILLDIEGALWSQGMFDRNRISPDQLPPLRKKVVSVDPNTGGQNEIGIVAFGTGPRPLTVDEVQKDALGDLEETALMRAARKTHGYILDDRTMRGASPEKWAKMVVRTARDFDVDYVVAEANQGGELVKYTIHTIDPGLRVKMVHATKNKKTRAEPIVALFEQDRIHSVGRFAALEDQCCTWDPESKASPDRMDAMVWGAHDTMGRGRIHFNIKPQGIGTRPSLWLDRGSR